MKKIIIIGLMCLMIIGTQTILAQRTKSNKKVTISGPILSTGKVHLRYKEKGKDPRDWTVNNIKFDMSYDQQTKIWLMVGYTRYKDKYTSNTAMFKVKYDESTNLSVIDWDFSGPLQWYMKESPKVTIKIGEENSSFRIDFIKNVEATNKAGEHWNIMKGSWLLVPRL